MVFSTSGEKGLSISSVGAAGVFEQTGSSQRTEMEVVEFDLSTWIWSFVIFIVTEDLDM